MKIVIQGHSDDIVEVLNDTTGDKEYDVGDTGMVVIRIGDPMKVVFLISVQYSDLRGWVFLLAIEGYELMTRRGVLPGRIDVGLSKFNNGPSWAVEVPDDTPVDVEQKTRRHAFAAMVLP